MPAMSPVFVLAAVLIGLLSGWLGHHCQDELVRWSEPGRRLVSLVVGLVTVLVASGLFMLMIYFILGESGGTT